MHKKKIMYIGYYWTGSTWVEFVSAKTKKVVEVCFRRRFGLDYEENPTAFKIEKERRWR